MTEPCEKIGSWPGVGAVTCRKRHICGDTLVRAAKEPLGIDLSDYSDEFVEGFLAGQVNAMEWVEGQR